MKLLTVTFNIWSLISMCDLCAIPLWNSLKVLLDPDEEYVFYAKEMYV